MSHPSICFCVECMDGLRDTAEAFPPPVPSIPPGSTLPDSGQREAFTTGAVRDAAEDKPRFGLIPVEVLKRYAMRYTDGAKKYGEWNWQKGIPLLRVYESLLRHVFAWREGDKSEDHLAAVLWNAGAIMWYEEQIKKGLLPASLAEGMPNV